MIFTIFAVLYAVGVTLYACWVMPRVRKVIEANNAWHGEDGPHD